MKPLELTVYPTWDSGDGRLYADKDDRFHPVDVDFEVYRKRLTDAELAAEMHAANADAWRAHSAKSTVIPVLEDRFVTLARFATLPHYDEAAS